MLTVCAFMELRDWHLLLTKKQDKANHSWSLLLTKKEDKPGFSFLHKFQDGVEASAGWSTVETA